MKLSVTEMPLKLQKKKNGGSEGGNDAGTRDVTRKNENGGNKRSEIPSDRVWVKGGAMGRADRERGKEGSPKKPEEGSVCTIQVRGKMRTRPGGHRVCGPRLTSVKRPKKRGKGGGQTKREESRHSRGCPAMKENHSDVQSRTVPDEKMTGWQNLWDQKACGKTIVRAKSGTS